MMSRPRKFAFLVHPRDLDDFYKKFPYLRFLPDSFIYFLTRKMPPVHVSNITGLEDKNGQVLEGCIISIPLTARQMLEDRELARTKIREAIQYARKKGVGIIGLGALTASLSRGGKDVEDRGVGITTGRAYTVKTVTEYVQYVTTHFSLPKKDITVAVVGAAGSIGSGCTEFLARNGYKHFILIDTKRRAERLKDVHETSDDNHTHATFRATDQLKEVEQADIIITATSAPEAVIHADDLSAGAIIVNDAQPSDVGDDVYDRDDVLVIEGGVIHTPGIKCNFNLGLADREDTFCCLGEVLILAHHHHFEHYALGYLNLNLIERITELERNLGFHLARPQNIHGYIDEQKMKHIKQILNEKFHGSN